MAWWGQRVLSALHVFHAACKLDPCLLADWPDCLPCVSTPCRAVATQPGAARAAGAAVWRALGCVCCGCPAQPLRPCPAALTFGQHTSNSAFTPC